jgi:hypothetical protein
MTTMEPIDDSHAAFERAVVEFAVLDNEMRARCEALATENAALRRELDRRAHRVTARVLQMFGR